MGNRNAPQSHGQDRLNVRRVLCVHGANIRGQMLPVNLLSRAVDQNDQVSCRLMRLPRFPVIACALSRAAPAAIANGLVTLIERHS